MFPTKSVNFGMFNYGTKFNFFFGLFMVLLYVALGGYIIFFWEGINNMPSYFRIIFGLVFIAYGVFRFIRNVKQKDSSS